MRRRVIVHRERVFVEEWEGKKPTRNSIPQKDQVFHVSEKKIQSKFSQRSKVKERVSQSVEEVEESCQASLTLGSQ